MVRLPVILHIHVKTSYSYLLLTFNGNFHFYAQTGVEGTYGAEENSFHFAYTVVSVVTVSAANPRLKQQCNGSMKSNPSPANNCYDIYTSEIVNSGYRLLLLPEI